MPRRDARFSALQRSPKRRQITNLRIALYHVSAYIALMAKRVFPIRLEDEMILDLTVYAATDQRSVSSLMRLILNEWLARRRPKEPT